MAEIESTIFDDTTPMVLKSLKYGEEWPVVYIINNDKEAYVGETVNASVRANQHLRKDERRRLTKINLIGDDKFNKSVILDLEGFLISHMAADGLFELQNNNMGCQSHNYYQQERYQSTFEDIWEQLRARKLTRNSVRDINNSDIFKYSPYKSLNTEQYEAVDQIIDILIDPVKSAQTGTVIVKGGAGSGKTVLAVYLVKILSEIGNGHIDIENDIDPRYIEIAGRLNAMKKLDIGFVVPMQSLRATVMKVFKGVRNLKQNMVISPVQVPKKHYDLLIVDEAHRLRQRKALAQYPPFDKNNRIFGLGKEGNELDWIMRSSSRQILFYDSMQSVKPSDIDREVFEELEGRPSVKVIRLDSQFRCIGGNDYIDYIKDILHCRDVTPVRSFGRYDLKMYSDADDMIAAIRCKDEQHGLCRVVAGYSWKWKSKKDKNAYDISIGDKSYRWNSVNKDWVNSENAVNEIGCIHTIQGYDLNYAGVIFGNEISYDPVRREICIDRSQYHDMQGKTALKNEAALKDYIVNIYATLMTRGIKGTYIYVCDEGLRRYFMKYIEMV